MFNSKEIEYVGSDHQNIQKQQKKLSELNKIIELTEQNETCRIDLPIENNLQPIKLSCFQSTINLLKRIYIYLFKRQKLIQVDINESQMSHLIDKLRNKKNGFQIILPPLKQNKKTLVLDLDQTLIHTSFKKLIYYDFQIEIPINGKLVTAYTIKRFGLDSFLFEMSQIYQIVIFTAGQKRYADQIISKIDPKGWISHRLYRQHCIVVNKTYYLKNLKILGRNLKNVVIVDDNRMGGVLQPDNFYRIQPFIGHQKDRKLFRLAAFLKYLNTVNDVRPVSAYRKKYEQTEIRLKQNVNSQIPFEGKKKLYHHRKSNSEVESLTQKDTNQQQDHQETNTHLVIR